MKECSEEDFIAWYCEGDSEIFEALKILFDREIHPDEYDILWSLKSKLKSKGE